ncbi:MAG: hypothetical protein HAW58_01285 [Candidatus Thioglobus sp.]|nr:hypothetical protein [Candidatus Thioglobus sp.]
MKTINKVIKFVVITAISAIMIGCGSSVGGSGSSGGGGGGSSSDKTLQGRFKDSNVDGLSYTGSFPGITTDGGRFNYQSGDILAFSIGDIELGTATASSSVTPSSLEGKNIQQISKIAQLLQSLDSEGTVADGITINEAALEVLADSNNANKVNEISDSLLNKASSILDFNLIVELNAAVSGSDPYAVVGETAANQHLLVTNKCAYSGGFRGTEIRGTGSFDSFSAHTPTDVIQMGFLIKADQNVRIIVENDNLPLGTLAFDGEKPIWNAIERKFTLDNLDILSGYKGTKEATTAKITAKRIGGGIDAIYRFTGAYQSTRMGSSLHSESRANVGGDGENGQVSGQTRRDGIFAFDIDSANAVTGVTYNIAKNEIFPLTGTLAGIKLIATSSDGTVIKADLNLSAGTIADGEWRSIYEQDTDNNVIGTFTGSGCRLN